MANLRICVRNIFDTATLSASPALVTTLPESNLQTMERYKTARSTSTASQDIKASWASAQSMNFIHTRMHNHTAAAQHRDRTYTDSAWTTGVVDNAAANCFAYTGFGDDDVLTEADFRLIKNSTRYITLVTNMQSYIKTITDAANPDGYFDISRLYGGKYYEFTYNPPYGGAPMRIQDFGTQDRVYDGSLISDKGAKARELTLRQNFMPEGNDWKELLSKVRSAGRDKDIFISLYPSDGTYLEAYFQGLFKLAEIPAFDRHMPGLADATLVLIES